MIRQFENGTFYLGDCLEIMKDIPDNSVDMILCDLPYGTTQNKWDSVIPFEPLWEQYWRVAKENTAVVLTAAQPFDKVLASSCIEQFRYEWIWKKDNGTGFLNAKRMPLRLHENILVFYKSQPVYNPQMRIGHKQYKQKQGSQGKNYGKVRENYVNESNGERFPVSILDFNRDKDKSHPTQKPVALFEYLIKTYTNEGMNVLDNCAGSGTTAISCENTNRNWICIEKDQDYFDTACKRIEKHTNNVDKFFE